MRRRYADDPEACKENSRRWRREHPARWATIRQRHYRAHKEQCRAGDTLRLAITRGEVLRQSCETCGDEPAHGHHEDYDKPLDVRWLCKPCHKRLHRDMNDAARAAQALTTTGDTA